MPSDLASRITVTCFAGSYGVGLALEAARSVWPRLPAWPVQAFVGAGVFAQALFLWHRGVEQGRLPIAAPFDALLTVSLALAALHLYLALRDRRQNTGLFLLPGALGLALLAAWKYSRDGSDPALGRNIVGIAHGVLLLLGAALAAAAMAAAAAYLAKSRQLRTGQFLDRVRLPSLERLDRMASGAALWGWPLFTLGVLLGFALRGLAWSDPKVWTTVAAWLAYAGLAQYRQRPEHRGRKFAWFTLAAGALVLFAVLADPLLGTSHQSRPAP